MQKQPSGFDVQREPMTSIAICTPLGDMVHTAYTVSMLQMCMHTLQSGPKSIGSIGFYNYASSLLPFSRIAIAKAALEANATHLLWIDSDMEFEPDMMIRLISHDLPIVAANCTMRRPPFRNTARVGGAELETSMDSTGIEKVDRTGFGVVLVKAEVFRAIEMPWFNYEWLPEQQVFRGEDYYFFEKARAAGFDCHIDQDVSKGVKHVGAFGYSPVIRSMTKSMAPEGSE